MFKKNRPAKKGGAVDSKIQGTHHIFPSLSLSYHYTSVHRRMNAAEIIHTIAECFFPRLSWLNRIG